MPIYINDCGYLSISENTDINNWFESKLSPGPRIRGMFNNCQQFDFYLPTQYEPELTFDTQPCLIQTTSDSYKRFQITITIAGFGSDMSLSTGEIRNDSSLLYSSTLVKVSNTSYKLQYLGEGENAHLRFTVTDNHGYTHYIDANVFINVPLGEYDPNECDISINSNYEYTAPVLPCGVTYGQGTLSLYANLFNDSCTCTPDPCNPNIWDFTAFRSDYSYELDYTYAANDEIRLIFKVPFSPYTDLAHQNVTVTNINTSTLAPISSSINYTENCYVYVFIISGIAPGIITAHTENLAISIANNNTLTNTPYYTFNKQLEINVDPTYTDWTTGAFTNLSGPPTNYVPLNYVSVCDLPTPTGCSLLDGVYTIIINNVSYCVFNSCAGTLHCSVMNNYLECDNSEPLVILNLLELSNQLLEQCTYTCSDLSLLYEKLLYSLNTACNTSTVICAPINTTKPKSNCGCSK